VSCWACYLNGRGFEELAFTVLGGVALCEVHAVLAWSKVMGGKVFGEKDLIGLDKSVEADRASLGK